MWSPPNKQALPSQDEMKYAQEAIDELESELEVAIQVLEQAKRHVAALTQDLEERKAWIAPVRKVPVEILSEIFIFTSEVDDLSPVTITEVCCFWRKVILSTPRAWSLIYADRLVKDSALYANSRGHIPKSNGLPIQYFSTFIQRSNPCTLHITMLPHQVYFDKESNHLARHPAQNVLVSAIHRAQCLSTPCWQIADVEPDVFPNLTKLTLQTGGYGIGPCFFDRSRFPCLQYLDCTNCPLDDSPVGTTLFPPLQHLAVNIRYGGWVKVVQGCANTLVALNVLERHGAARIPRAAISFPKLNSLAFRTDSYVTTDLVWPIQATTPSLQSYEQMRQDRQSMVHHDVQNVTHICTNQMMDLQEFVALRVLQFDLHDYDSPLHVIRAILNRLRDNKDLCPLLQTIRFSLSEEDYGDSFKSWTPGFNKTARRARPDITLCFTDKALKMLPGSFEEAAVGIVTFHVLDVTNFPQCGRDMPCVLKRDQL